MLLISALIVLCLPSALYHEGNRIATIEGVIEDGMMHTVLIADSDGQIYQFDKSNAEITTGESGMRIGNPITITYTGELDPTQTAQQVTVLSIVVKDTAQWEQSFAQPQPQTAAEQAQKLLASMSLEEKVGQMFLVRCPKEQAAEKAAQYHLGGYILFGRDFADKSQKEVAQNISSYQQAATIPLLIGVDEEGGTVNRISSNPTFRAEPFPSPQALYEKGGWDAIRQDTMEKCSLLHSLGIQLNFAPVCDVATNPDSYMYPRTFGQDSAQTARYIETVVQIMQEQRIGSVLKHFPGYGDCADTHTGIAYDDRSYQSLQSSDFVPFQAGIDAGAPIVLVSHNIVSSIDAQYPASLSPAVHDVLRNELGFSGVIITDDLYMEGVRQFADDTQTAVLAVLAGNDLLCCTDFEVQIPAVIQAVETGQISQQRIDASVLRILQLKISLGLL